MATGTRRSNRNQTAQPPAPLFNIPDPPKIKAPPRKKPAEEARPLENDLDISATPPVVPPSSPPAVPPPVRKRAGLKSKTRLEEAIEKSPSGHVPPALPSPSAFPAVHSPPPRFRLPPRSRPPPRSRSVRPTPEPLARLPSRSPSRDWSLPPVPQLGPNHKGTFDSPPRRLPHDENQEAQSDDDEAAQLSQSDDGHLEDDGDLALEHYKLEELDPELQTEGGNQSEDGEAKNWQGSDGDEDEDEDDDWQDTRVREAKATIAYNQQPGIRGTSKEYYVRDAEIEKDDLRDFRRQAVPEGIDGVFGPLAVAGSSNSRQPKGRSHSRSRTQTLALHRPKKLQDSDDESHDDDELRPQPQKLSEDNDGADEDDDADVDDTEQGWRVKRGPIPEAAVLAATESVTWLYGDLRTTARKYECNVTTLAQKAGLTATFSRETSGWGAYKFVWRTERIRPDNVTPKDWAKQCRDSYHALIAELPEEERNDPAARRRLMQPFIDTFLAASVNSYEDTKQKHRTTLNLMQKTLRPMIAQSKVISLAQDFEIIGICADLHHRDNNAKNVLSWGGSKLYHEARDRYPEQFDKIAGDFYAILKRTETDIKLEEEGELAKRNPIDVPLSRPPGKAKRDHERTQLVNLSLNSLYLVLLERPDTTLADLRSKFPKIQWKIWADFSVLYHVRWNGWPVGFKSRYPGHNFVVNQIANGEDAATDGVKETATLTQMVQAMANAYRVYQGDDEVEDTTSSELAPYIESWTAEEMALEDPSNVPIVVCADGTVLARAKSSIKLSKALEKTLKGRTAAAKKKASGGTGKAAAGKGKATGASAARKRSRPPAGADSDDSDDDDGPPPAKRSRGSSSPARDDEEEEPKDLGEDDGPNYTKIAGLKCRYFNAHRKVSQVFDARGIRAWKKGEEVHVRHRWTEFKIQGEWKRMKGYRPVLSTAQRELALLIVEEISFD
ncbi:hypothetical protein C8F01DRAFT_1248119 [Mycena amicta]|nr:hypothetical protein C8F01DRAFT_1248119 [Mycena amicta]